MKITPLIRQVQGMILVSLQATFVGGPNDAEDKANILAFGDPMVDLTGGLFVDNNTYLPQPATAVVQGITFTTTVEGPAANQVSINFISAGQPDATAISVTGNAITVDIYDTMTASYAITSVNITSSTNAVLSVANTAGFVTGAPGVVSGLTGGTNTQVNGTWVIGTIVPNISVAVTQVNGGTWSTHGAASDSGTLTTSSTRTTASVVALFANYAASTVTTNGGTTLASGGSGVGAAVTVDPLSFAGGAASYVQAFQFSFPASDLYVGVTTQMQGYTARFMTQLPPAPRGIPEEHWEYEHRYHPHHGHHTHGSLDCVTSDPQHAATFWIATIESRISDLMVALRQRTPLGAQTDATV